MKNYIDLTKEELSNLTYEDVQNYIKLSCAEQGIPMLPELPEKPTKPNVEPDVTYFEVGNYLLDTQEKAIEVCNILNKHVMYDTSRDYNMDVNYKPHPHYNSQKYTVTPKKVVSEVLWNKYKSEIENFKKEDNAYDKIRKLYDEIKRKQKDIVDEISALWEEACDWKQRKEVLFKGFDQYIKLAENNFEIAYNFLIKANPEIETEYSGIKEELSNKVKDIEEPENNLEE